MNLAVRELQEDTRTCLWVDEDTHSIQMNTDKDKKYAFDCVCDKNSQQDMFEKVGKKSTEYCMEGIFFCFIQGIIVPFLPMGRQEQGRPSR